MVGFQSKLVLIKISWYAKWRQVHIPIFCSTCRSLEWLDQKCGFGWVVILLLSCCHFLGNQHSSLEFPDTKLSTKYSNKRDILGDVFGWFLERIFWSMKYIELHYPGWPTSVANLGSLPGPVKSALYLTHKLFSIASETIVKRVVQKLIFCFEEGHSIPVQFPLHWALLSIFEGFLYLYLRLAHIWRCCPKKKQCLIDKCRQQSWPECFWHCLGHPSYWWV